jgi:DNA-binding transcriptional ArsR family regulator
MKIIITEIRRSCNLSARHGGVRLTRDVDRGGYLANCLITESCKQEPMRTDRLDGVFAALADPTRRAILVRLAEGEASVGELAQPFALSLPTVSRHIDVLEAVGLVARERQAQRRICRLQAEPLMQAGEWIARYAAFWEGRLDALARLVQDLDERERRDARDEG